MHNIIGITGGIGAGKSIVCSIFRNFGVPVYDSDSEAKKLYKNQEVIELIASTFGSRFIVDNKLDLKMMGRAVFSNQTLLEQLNSIMHPRLSIEFEKWCILNNDHTYVLKEAAIMIESGTYKDCRELILVTSAMESRIERVMKRSYLTREEVLERISKQMSDDEKSKYCNYNIVNDETNLLIPQVLQLHEKLSCKN
jgi:dephospho-CoA kinase